MYQEKSKSNMKDKRVQKYTKKYHKITKTYQKITKKYHKGP